MSNFWGSLQKAALFIIRHFEVALNTILIGNNAVSIALSYVSTYLFLLWLPSSVDPFITSLIASVTITLLVYFFGETLPKQVGKKIPNRLAPVLSYPLIFFLILFFPFTMTFYGFNKLLNKMFHKKKNPELTEDDFNAALEDNRKEGALDSKEKDIISNSFAFSDIKAKDILTPASQVMMIDLKGKSNDDIAQILINSPYSRVPVCYGSKERIIGVLIVKTFLTDYLQDKNCSLIPSLQKPFVISSSQTVQEIITGLQENHTMMAIVYSNNSFQGLVTSTDCLEELVGPVHNKEEKKEGQAL